MNKAERDEIRAQCEEALELIDARLTAKKLSVYEYRLLHDAINETGNLLDLINAMMSDTSLQDMLTEVESDRDRWKARAEALEAELAAKEAGA